MSESEPPLREIPTPGTYSLIVRCKLSQLQAIRLLCNLITIKILLAHFCAPFLEEFRISLNLSLSTQSICHTINRSLILGPESESESRFFRAGVELRILAY